MKKLITPLLVILSLGLILIWQILSSSTNYYIVAVVILLLSMLPILFDYENSKPSARELALISSLIAIAVVSRAVFYLIPQVKPIGAVVIVSGMTLGARRGYLVGAFSAFVSNFIFGQGIWTPFQMVALGMVGFISGVILKPNSNRFLQAFIGFVLCFAVYGVIVDASSVLVMTNDYSLASVFAIYSAGVPFSLVFGGSTAVFLFLFGKAFSKKVNRLIQKYGIIEKR